MFGFLKRNKFASGAAAGVLAVITAVSIMAIGSPNLWGYSGWLGGSIYPAVTGGASDTTAVEFGSGSTATTLLSGSFDMTSATDEEFHAYGWLPYDYLNGGALKFFIEWVATDTDLATIELEFYCKAVGNGEPIAGSWGSGIVITDTSEGANKNNITSEVTITPHNAPERNDKLLVKIFCDKSGCTLDEGVVYPIITAFKYPKSG
jgi:hypothetical protein